MPIKVLHTLRTYGMRPSCIWKHLTLLYQRLAMLGSVLELVLHLTYYLKRTPRGQRRHNPTLDPQSYYNAQCIRKAKTQQVCRMNKLYTEL